MGRLSRVSTSDSSSAFVIGRSFGFRAGRVSPFARWPGQIWRYFVPAPTAVLTRRDDILLVVEVADSSLRYERRRKVRLCAVAGIPEYWVVGVQREWVEVYRTPEGDGYRDVRRVPQGDTIAPLSFPDLVIPVADIFA